MGLCGSNRTASMSRRCNSQGRLRRISGIGTPVSHLKPPPQDTKAPWFLIHPSACVAPCCYHTEQTFGAQSWKLKVLPLHQQSIYWDILNKEAIFAFQIPCGMYSHSWVARRTEWMTNILCKIRNRHWQSSKNWLRDFCPQKFMNCEMFCA
jgi:hypothetical protein